MRHGVALESILPYGRMRLVHVQYVSLSPGFHLPGDREREGDDMRCAMLSFLAIVINAFLGCQIGCGEDSADVSFVEQGLSDEEVLTSEELFVSADWTTRSQKSKEAFRRYFKLRDTSPAAALKTYIDFHKWLYHGHPLAEKSARLEVKMDMAGKTNIPDRLRLLNIELEIATDLNESPQYIEEIEEKIFFWTELAEELEAEGHNPADFEIEFEIVPSIEEEE